MRVRALVTGFRHWISLGVKAVSAGSRSFLSADRRCSLCGGVFQDDLPCHVCRECWGRLPLWDGPVCSVCGKPLMSTGTSRAEASDGLVHCRDCCDRITFIDGTVYTGLYTGYLRETVRNLKYRGFTYLGAALGGILGEGFAARHGLQFTGSVVPIPLHPSRLEERGFNQAESIARGFSKAIGARLVTGSLEKVRETPDQKLLGGKRRANNVRGAFGVVETSAVIGRDIALVDDVMTTGSTANEAARVLKSCGAKHVYAVVVASGLGLLCRCRTGKRIPQP